MLTSHTPAITASEFLQHQAASLLLYQSVLSDEVGQAYINLLQTLSDNRDQLACLQAYGDWFKALAARNQSWQEYLVTRILQDDNPFSQQAQRLPIQDLPPAVIAAAQQDLQALQQLYQCSSQHLSQWVQQASQSPTTPVDWNVENSQATFLQQQNNWADALDALVAYYRQHGTGLFAQYHALGWQQGKLVGIAHPDQVRLNEIVGYEWQREALVKNTEFLLAGYPAQNVLLYGSRGSGKSSLVKGLLHEFGKQGLRLVEVGKSNLKYLPAIIEQLRNVPQKFIVFVDDLSFEEDDEAFKALKAVLEGSLTARAENVVVYATSNRRHLVREFFDDRPRPRDKDEVHSQDTMQEKLSFSDRFGLTLTFEPANQDTYLQIVRHLAAETQISLKQEELEFRAKQWATRHNGRSGRSARQFIDFVRAELAMSQPN